MRAIAYFLYDPLAPRGDPATRARMDGAMRRYCDANRHTLEQTFAFPKRETPPAQALGRMAAFLEGARAPYLVALASPLHLGATPEEGVEALLKLDSLGARVVSIQEGGPSLIGELFGAMAKEPQESSAPTERAKNIREAMYRKAVRGEGLGKPPYGFCVGKTGKLEEAPEESKVVRLIFQLYVEQGLGIRNIVRELNNGGRRTRRNANWSMVTIRDILRNPAYVGTYRRFGMRIPRSHAALVDRGIFRKAQDLMDSRAPHRRKASPQPFLLSGLAVCGQCGNSMIGVTRRQAWRNKDGSRMQGVYRYYQCQSRTNQSVCRYHTWRAPALEEAAIAGVRRHIQERPELLGATPQAVRAAAAPPGDDSRRRYLSYVQQAAEGAIPLARLRELLDGMTTAAPPGTMGTPATATGDEPFSGAAILDEARWQSMDDSLRRQALERWVARIEVGEKEVTVRLRV
ncbi:MAG: recombinase family protein [Chloroflexi bacterium]|nr:recombinase family protein [Chloroflexota bacterium]